MRKISVCILSLALAAALAGCSSGTDSDKGSGDGIYPMTFPPSTGEVTAITYDPDMEADLSKETDFELLTAIITDELTDDTIIVCPVEGEWELNSSDKIFASKEWADESIRSMLKVGTTVVIQYDGLIMETYPAQINADKLWIQSSEDTSPEEPEDNSAPAMLTVHYYFKEKLSKEAADEYIKGIESIAEVTDSVDLNVVPADNFSSNFLEKGTKLYVVADGIVAVYDDDENYYAALLAVDKDIN